MGTSHHWGSAGQGTFPEPPKLAPWAVEDIDLSPVLRLVSAASQVSFCMWKGVGAAILSFPPQQSDGSLASDMPHDFHIIALV